MSEARLPVFAILDKHQLNENEDRRQAPERALDDLADLGFGVGLESVDDCERQLICGADDEERQD